MSSLIDDEVRGSRASRPERGSGTALSGRAHSGDLDGAAAIRPRSADAMSAAKSVF